MTIPFMVSTAEAGRGEREGHAPMANSKIAVMPVGVAAVKTLPQCLSTSASRRHAACLSRTRASCVASRARIAGLAHHGISLDHKKGAELPP